MSARALAPEVEIAVTPRLADKALHLPVKAEARKLLVGSGSEPGVVYEVVPGQPDDINTWWCSCIGSAGCSHVWAAYARLDPAVRRALRKAAKGT